MEIGERRTALDRFYRQLAMLEAGVGGKRLLHKCHGQMDWPQRGVYFFFEEDEFREDGITPRVVRVGTHGLRTSSSTLWGRLSQHRGSRDGAKPGGGNHRGSIFRLHVGAALLSGDDWPVEVRSTWGVGNTAKGKIREEEYALEAAVSRYIGAMPFLWLAVDDEPSADSERGVIEAGAISLLSNFEREPIDAPSHSWLGLRSNRKAIQKSGLWNVRHVSDASSKSFLAHILV